MIKPIFAPLQPQKPPCSRFIYVACARTLYIGETSKTLLFAACVSLQPLSCSICMLANFRFWYVCSRLFLFPFSLAFCSTKIMCETLCKFLYFYASLKCMFMQSIMVNRKLFGNFEFSQHLCANVLSFYFLFSRFSFCFGYSEGNESRNEKDVFCRFCPKTSLFVANNVLIFRDLHLYRANHTPPPRFWHSQGGSALFRKFFIFLFLFFCKIL